MFRRESNNTSDPKAPVMGVDHQDGIIIVVVLPGHGVLPSDEQNNNTTATPSTAGRNLPPDISQKSRVERYPHQNFSHSSSKTSQLSAFAVHSFSSA